MIRQLKQWARSVKQDVSAVYLACRDPRVPWTARVVAVLVVAYALSPIDLIPDVIPVLGYLDDLLLVPLGLALVLRLIPREVMDECRERVRTQPAPPPNRLAAACIIALWLLAGVWVVQMVVKHVQ